LRLEDITGGKLAFINFSSGNLAAPFFLPLLEQKLVVH